MCCTPHYRRECCPWRGLLFRSLRELSTHCFPRAGLTSTGCSGDERRALCLTLHSGREILAPIELVEPEPSFTDNQCLVDKTSAFAVEHVFPSCGFVWLINDIWLLRHSKNPIGEKLFKRRLRRSSRCWHWLFFFLLFLLKEYFYAFEYLTICRCHTWLCKVYSLRL